MARTSSSSDALVCPGCARTQPPTERFCPTCALPLTFAGDGQGPAGDEVTDRQARARKIKPQLAEGELVKVAGARNQAEAEFVQGLLLEEGVPSALRRARGFDVPDFLAAGPRDVLVPASGVAVARDVLLESELDPLLAPGGPVHRPGAVLAGLVAACGLVTLVAWIGTQLAG